MIGLISTQVIPWCSYCSHWKNPRSFLRLWLVWLKSPGPLLRLWLVWLEVTRFFTEASEVLIGWSINWISWGEGGPIRSDRGGGQQRGTFSNTLLHSFTRYLGILSKMSGSIPAYKPLVSKKKCFPLFLARIAWLVAPGRVAQRCTNQWSWELSWLANLGSVPLHCGVEW